MSIATAERETVRWQWPSFTPSFHNHLLHLLDSSSPPPSSSSLQLHRSRSNHLRESVTLFSTGGDNPTATVAANTSFKLRDIYERCNTWKWRGYAINFLVTGQGPPLLLVHGFGTSVGHWRSSCMRDGHAFIDIQPVRLYLEERYPEHPLLPNDLQKRALDLQVANIVCSSIQPYQNIGVLSYIEQKVSSDEQFVWVRHHIGKGFTALENLLEGFAGKYATGDEVFLADLFLAPQIHAAKNRFNLDMAKFPLLCGINEAYDVLPAFRAAMPDMQPDAVKL